MRFRGFLYLLFLLFPLVCKAQIKKVGTPNILNFPKSAYNAGMQNWDISQDSKGFLYFANTEGVLKFDGFHWDLISIPGSSPLRSILVDNKDRIFVGKGNDFGVLTTLGTGSVKYISLRYLIPDSIPDFDDIWRIFETREGIVFQCYDYLFLYKDDSIRIVKPTKRFHFSFLVRDRLILHEPGNGLYELDGVEVRKLKWSDQLKEFDIEAVYDFGDDKLLIGTARNGLFIYLDDRVEKWNSPASEYLKENVLFSSEKLTDHHFAWGTILDGLIISDHEGEIIQHINRKAGLQNNTVLNMFNDRDDNLWLGLDNGISYLELNSPLSFISDLDLLGSGYSCILFNGNLYLGTNRGLFFKSWLEFQSNKGKFKIVEGTEGQVWSLQEFDGQLICGHNLGTFIIKGEKGLKISDIEGAWKYIRVDGRPDLLIGGHYAGLLLLKKNGKNWSFYKNVAGFKESSRFLFQNEDGSLWMSHGGKGVFRINLNQAMDSVTDYKLYDNNNGLPSNEQNILLVHENVPYVSTVKGLFQYDSEKDIFKVNDKLNALFEENDRLMALTSDQRGSYWYICESGSGVLRVNEDQSLTRIMSPFSKLHGVFIREFEFIYPLNDENIFYGTDNGFAHYTSGRRKSYSDVFNAFITTVELPYLDSLININEITNKRAFEFPFRQNSFRFHYTSPFYENIEQLRFSYYLDNYTDTWSAWIEDSYKDYTNLAEGDYRFIIKAKNSYGYESTHSVFEFTILPPWYRSRLAYYCYIIILFIAFITTVKLFRRRVEKLKIKQKEKHEKELKDIDEKFQRDTLIAEKELIRVRNEKLRNEMIHRDKELANQTMGIIQKNRFLIKLKGELSEVLKGTTDSKVIQRMASIDKKIDREINSKQQNKVFETYFDGVHSEFFKRLKEKHPDLSPREMYLSAYLRMNLTTKEISALQNISDRGVEIGRYRLRKKLGILRDTNLSTYLSNI